MCKNIKNKTDDLIIENFSKSLAVPFDLGYDILEDTIDAIVDNEIVRKIPIIKSIVATKDFAISVYKKFEVKKIIIFLNELNKHSQDPKIDKMKKKIETDGKYLRKEAELALIVLERAIESDKAPLIAELFYQYVIDKIKLTEYKELIIIIHALFVSDAYVLKKISDKLDEEVTVSDVSSLNRLEGIGVVRKSVISEIELNYNHYEMTLIGEKLMDIAQKIIIA